MDVTIAPADIWISTAKTQSDDSISNPDRTTPRNSDVVKDPIASVDEVTSPTGIFRR